MCPSGHYYCPNCKVRGHAPSDKAQCRFWRKNRNAEWIEKHAKEAESLRAQKEREAKELQKARRAGKKAADEAAAAARQADQEMLDDVHSGLEEIRASMEPGPST